MDENQMKQYRFSLIPREELNTEEYLKLPQKRLYTTFPWLSFIRMDACAEPFFVRISSDGQFVGYFTGANVSKFGIRICGSPFSGWSTCYMGLDLLQKDEKCAILRQLIPFLYRELKCSYVEVIDRDVSAEEAERAGFTVNRMESLELDITKDDAGLFKQMKTDCRNFIRQFERRGARIEIAAPDDLFAEQYYDQLKDVFAKQNLVPSYSVEKVKRLLHALSDSGSVLCLRVLSPDDRCIATSIFIGYGKTAYFWGGASYRPDQHYRPNEYMIWTAIRYWRERGCTVLDMCGVRDYKRKFGPVDISYAQMIFSKRKLLIPLRNTAMKLYYAMMKAKGVFFRKK